MKLFSLFSRKSKKGDSPPNYDSISIRSMPPMYSAVNGRVLESLPEYTFSESLTKEETKTVNINLYDKIEKKLVNIINSIDKTNEYVILDKKINPMSALNFLINNNNNYNNIILYSVHIRYGTSNMLDINGHKLKLSSQHTYFYGLNNLKISVDDCKFDWSSKMTGCNVALSSTIIKGDSYGNAENGEYSVNYYEKKYKRSNMNFLEYMERM
jgi:hypothetical protein